MVPLRLPVVMVVWDPRLLRTDLHLIDGMVQELLEKETRVMRVTRLRGMACFVVIAWRPEAQGTSLNGIN